MKIPGPEVFENEWFALFDQYYEEFPEAKVAGVDEESIEILWKKHAKQQEIRMLEHASTLLKEWYSYRARSGDECELYDYDGSFSFSAVCPAGQQPGAGGVLGALVCLLPPDCACNG